MKPVYSLRQTCMVRGVLLFIGSSTLLWIANYLAEMAGGWIPHAVSHFSASVVGALILFGSRSWLRTLTTGTSQQSQIDARMLTAGIAIFTIAQLVEAGSAIIEYPHSGALHDISGMVTLAGLLVCLLGMATVVFNLLRRSAVSRWAYIVLAGFALFGIFLLLTLVLGLG